MGLLQALEADPQASLPHVAACVSMGRLALFSENKAKVGLGFWYCMIFLIREGFPMHLSRPLCR